MQQYSCSPRNAAGGLGGVEECCTILEKWYYNLKNPPRPGYYRQSIAPIVLPVILFIQQL
ncbi:hypothetical protein QUA43_29755 [Microcoleus sp. N9_B4]